MRALITGAGGQLGWALRRAAPTDAAITALERGALDITVAGAVNDAVAQHRPDVILNGAAYTAVDKAEQDREAAFATNELGAANLARAAAACGAWLAHVSTDFVFDGRSPRPYKPDAQANPLNVYGASKLAGERHVLAVREAGFLVLRTSWLYGARGRNFVTTMVRLMRERERLDVVADQVGTPTWAKTLAEAVWRAAGQRAAGVLHWSDAGVASWYDFAVAIQEEASAIGLLERAVPIHPIATDDCPTPARRPPYSVLETSATRAALGMPASHWRVNLRRMLRELKDQVECADSSSPAARAS